jgi:hypothetical protein
VRKLRLGMEWDVNGGFHILIPTLSLSLNQSIIHLQSVFGSKARMVVLLTFFFGR